MQDIGDRLPVPDPTRLTTEALLREIASLRELLTGAIDARADLTDEKFEHLKQQMVLVEKWRVEQKQDTRDAVDAALAALRRRR